MPRAWNQAELTFALALDFDLQHLPAGVVTAARADVMLPLVLAALRTGHQRNRRQLVVLATEALLGPGNPLLW